MKNIVLLLLTTALIFASCDLMPEDEDDSLSVSSVDAGDLTDYTDNGIAPSRDGAAEVEASIGILRGLSSIIVSWGSTQEDIASVISPSEPGNFLREIVLPNDDDMDSIMAMYQNHTNGSIDTGFEVIDEVVNLSDLYGSYQTGQLVLNGEVAIEADLETMDDSTGTDSAAVEAEFEIKGTDWVIAIEPDSPILDLQSLILEVNTLNEIEHKVKDDEETLTCSIESALVVAFSLSDFNGYTTSGKYVFTLSLDETYETVLNVDSEEEEDVTIDGVLSLVIYDNEGEEKASYEFDQEALENLFM